LEVEEAKASILPGLTEEVNTSASFAPLRQAYFGEATKLAMYAKAYSLIEPVKPDAQLTYLDCLRDHQSAL
jgi:hypothetical protein